VWWVDLVEAASRDDAEARLARALGVDRSAVAHTLRAAGPALVVLDPLEHVPDADAWLEALAETPELRVLSTSRQALRGSRAVAPLGEEAAVELLADRAARRGVHRADPATLGAIARRLGGLPLMLELAAGRLGVLSAEEILENLGLALLRSGRPGLPARDATLEGALDWSRRLLGPDEQRGLAELSVFRGGFSLPAAEAVLTPCPGRWTAVDVVEALVDAGLVHRSGPARFGLLGPIAEYAGRHLADRAVVERHASWFAAAGTDAAVRAADRTADVREAMPDLDNRVAACERAIDAGWGALAVGALRAVWSILQRSGGAARGLALAERVHAIPGAEASARAWACSVAGQACRYLDRMEDGLGWYDRARAAAVEARDRRMEGLVLGNRANLLVDRGRVDAGGEAFLEAVAVLLAVGAGRSEALALDLLGRLARDRRQFAEARRWFAQALAVCDAHGQPSVAMMVRGTLGITLFREGRLDEALALQRSVVRCHAEVGDRANEGLALQAMYLTLWTRGEREEALEVAQRARVLLREVGLVRQAAELDAKLAEDPG
jgi:predicted ATPase